MQTYSESRLTTEELFKEAYSLWSSVELYAEDNPSVARLHSRCLGLAISMVLL
jgi:hypothetical protein